MLEKIKEQMRKIRKQLLEVLKNINRIDERLQRKRLLDGFSSSDLEQMPITANMNYDLEKMVARLVYCHDIDKWRHFIHNAKNVADSPPIEQQLDEILVKIQNVYHTSTKEESDSPTGYERYLQGIVAITNYDNDKKEIQSLFGTGFLVSFHDEIYVVTCQHVLKSIKNDIGQKDVVFVKLTISNELSNELLESPVAWLGKPMDTDEKFWYNEDIAILGLDKTCLPSRSRPFNLQDHHFAGKTNCYCYGYIKSRLPTGRLCKGLRCNVLAYDGLVEVSQVQKEQIEFEGASGAPLSDANGNIIGMINACNAKAGLVYMIPITNIMNAFDQIEKEILR